jgi:integrase
VARKEAAREGTVGLACPQPHDGAAYSLSRASALDPGESAGRHRNPCRRQARSRLSPEEIDRYLAALSDDPEARLFYALAEHGLRAGEILGLDVDDVRVGADVLEGAAGAITVRRALAIHPRELDETKTATSRRTVPVFDGSVLIRVLSEYLAKTGRSEGLLLGPDGVALPTYRTIMRRAERRFKRAQLDTTVTPHVFRHSAGSLWLRAGVAPTTVASWLGHSVQTLMRVYAHVIEGLAMTSEIERVQTFRAATKVGG